MVRIQPGFHFCLSKIPQLAPTNSRAVGLLDHPGQETPDPPDEECDDKDHQKDITNLDDTITNKADDTESVKVDDKIDDGVLDSAADKDEVKDDENDNKWAPGTTEVYTTTM